CRVPVLLMNAIIWTNWLSFQSRYATKSRLRCRIDMEKRLDFRFEIPAQPKGPLIEMSAVEMEKTLLKRLEDEKSQPTEALWQLARFYGDGKQHEKAIECFR